MYKLILLCIITMFVGCDYNSFSLLPSTENVDIAHNTTIGELRQLCIGGAAIIDDNLVVEGWVSATDKSNNFYRSVVVQDATGAVEIKAGLMHLHNTFGRGQHIYIKLKGCAIGLSGEGIVQIGRGKQGSKGLEVDYFEYRTILDKHVVCDVRTAKVEPQPVTLALLRPSMCGQLVEINSLVLLQDEEPTWTTEQEYVWMHYRHFASSDGELITVATSSYADFASKRIPLGTVSLVGILMYGKAGSGSDVYMLKLRDEADIIL